MGYASFILCTGSFPTRYRFTGQKQDASGLVYMNARYGVHPEPAEGIRRTGQFISPDSLVAHLNCLYIPLSESPHFVHCLWSGRL